MRKTLIAFLLLYSISINAQEEELKPVVYQTAVGGYFELGSESNLFGVQIKQFLDHWHAVNGQILFDSETIILGVDYSFNNDLPFAYTISWYFGGGAQVAFLNKKDDTSFALRPMVGVEYKARDFPMVVNVEFKPFWSIGKEGQFDLNRFGIGVKYVLHRDIW